MNMILTNEQILDGDEFEDEGFDVDQFIEDDEDEEDY
jgi:hypothetical protein